MAATNCNSLKAAVLSYLSDSIEITELRDRCVLTLPTKTIDDRYADVFIEQRLKDSFLVHDAGMTVSQLFAQGIHLTEGRERSFCELAEKFHVTFADGAFKSVCKLEDIQRTIIAISQCATLGSWYVLGHRPSVVEEPVLARVERGIRAWNPGFPVLIEPRVHLTGRTSDHVFEFGIYPKGSELAFPVLTKVLRPSVNSAARAREYGFTAYDLDQTDFQSWLRFAVITKSEEWSKDAKGLIRKLSNSTVEVNVGDEESLVDLIPIELRKIAA